MNLRPFLGLLFLLLIACARTHGGGEATQVKATCPSSEFPVFVEMFISDARLQESFTRFPYETIEYDPQNLDSDPRVAILDKEDVDFPLIFNRRLLEERGVKIEISKKADDLYEVFTRSQGSGAYSRTYLFKKYADCWFLVSMTDGST